MAIAPSDLTFNANVDGHFKWNVTVSDNVATTKGGSYFNPLNRTVRDGDFLMMNCSDGKWLARVAGVTPGSAVSADVWADGVTSFS